MNIDFVDWALVRDVISWALFLIGSAAIVIGAIGIVRFPDFYTRLHAAGVTDTAGAELILLAMIFQAPTWLIAAKIAFVGFFLFFTSPVSTHAIAHAAWAMGLKPMTGSSLTYEEGEE